jgi:hypothetical protein
VLTVRGDAGLATCSLALSSLPTALEEGRLNRAGREARGTTQASFSPEEHTDGVLANEDKRKAMTKAEREELTRLIKARMKLGKQMADQRGAKLLADAEAQLAQQFKINDPIWSDLTALAVQAVKDADAEIARRCEDLGIPAEFRPKLSVDWYSRGENMAKERRAELRRVAERRIEALIEQAKTAIEQHGLEGLTQLVSGALETAEAQAFLAALPTVETLMPKLDVAKLGPLALGWRPEVPADDDDEP